MSKTPHKSDLDVVGAMLADPMAWHRGPALSKQAGIRAGTVYPVLARLERSGWLQSRWEADPGGGERRRLYRLTGVGERMAVIHLGRERRSPRAWRLPWRGPLLPGSRVA